VEAVGTPQVGKNDVLYLMSLEMSTRMSQINVRKTEGAIKIGPSRKPDNIRYTKHMTKTNKYLSMIFSRFKQTFGRKPKGLSGMDIQ